MLSRNFRLQKIGNLEWLNQNYNFETVSRHIDELVILNVSRSPDGHWPGFLETVQVLAQRNFVPISVGGFGPYLDRAGSLLRSGADKLIVNRALFSNIPFVESVVEHFGRQCVVGSIDLKSLPDSTYQPYFPTYPSGHVGYVPLSWENAFPDHLVGELMIRSVDRDGTGQGLDFELLARLPAAWSVIPLVFAGGVGKAEHIIEGFSFPSIQAVATANLLNFMGEGLENSRRRCAIEGFDLAKWA